MSFNPQYSIWSRDTLDSRSGATIESPADFNIVGGVTKLIPNVFTQGTYSFNAPWDPVTGWDIENSMDSDPIVQGDFYIYETGGGSHGNINSIYQTAYYTSGDASAFVYDRDFVVGTGLVINQLTTEFRVRAFPTAVTGGAPSPFSGDYIRHGIYISDHVEYAFIEVLSDGIRVHGQNEAIMHGDFGSKLRKVRVVKDISNLSIITDDNSHLYIASGFTQHIRPQTGSYVAFGAARSGTYFDGTYDPITGNIFHDIDHGSRGFTGITLWDDVKISEGQAVTRRPQNYIPPYPTGLFTLYTDSWKMSPNVESVPGLYLEMVPHTGGVTSVTVEQLLQTGVFGETHFVTTNVAPTTYHLGSKTTHFINTSDIRLQSPPFTNELRLKVQSRSLGGAAPELDTITFIGSSPYYLMETTPNWKLSSMGKEIYFGIDKQRYASEIPPVHHTDLLYFHNEAGERYIFPGFTVEPINGLTHTGEVLWHAEHLDAAPTGFVTVGDGIHGPAWRNFNLVNNYIGKWESDAVRDIDFSGQYRGQILGNYTQYPVKGIKLVTGQAEVRLFVDEYIDLDENPIKAQRVVVENYYGGIKEHMGIAMTGIHIPLKSSGLQYQMGVIEGTIQIYKGPGVVVALHELDQFDSSDTKNTVFLNGEDYREPRPFACAALYSGNHASNNADTYLSIGVLPRSGRPEDVSEADYTLGWKRGIELHSIDEFTVFGISGYMVGHAYLGMSGLPADTYKSSEFLGPKQWYSTGDAVNIGDLQTFEEVNAALIASGNALSGYHQVETDSPVFEGWFRPFGIKEHADINEVILAEVQDSSNKGLILYIDRDGHISATVDMVLSNPAAGKVQPGATDQQTYVVASTKDKVRWGDWNHIGVVVETKLMGDGYQAFAQPKVPTPEGNVDIFHGARTSRLYLTINGKIAGSIDTAGNPYDKFTFNTGSVASDVVIPKFYQTAPILPSVPRFDHSGSWTIRLGERVFADYDHIRYGVRERAEVLTDLLVKGSKTTPPLISPDDALKPPTPISGGVGHIEVAHIYRFDEPFDNSTLDWGFSPAHANIVGGTGESELTSYGLTPYHFIKKVEGPLGRPAIHIGPGARIESPWSSFNDAIFNGTGSFSVDHQKLYSTTVSGGVLEHIATGDGDAFSRLHANNHLMMAGWFNLEAVPHTGVMDLLTFDMDSADHLYGDGQAYVGVDPAGRLLCGTRFDYRNDLGPFSGDVQTRIQPGTWFHAGIDIWAPAYEAGSVTLYYEGSGIKSSVILCDQAGDPASIVRGYPLGYGGLLDTGDTNGVRQPVFRVGGDIPRNDTSYPAWTYRYGKYYVSEWAIGFGLTVSGAPDYHGWDWHKLAGWSGDTGLQEKAFANGAEVGLVSGVGEYFTGQLYYPPTVIQDAGEQILWTTANQGNDYAGIGKGGMQVFNEKLFINAASYYAVYENDNADEKLGSTDSPIQIGYSVPPEGVNLSLINITPWSSKKSVSSFDLSDSNPSNITPKIHGDIFVPFVTGEEGLVARGAVASEAIRVSSLPIYDIDNRNQFVGYFMHLVGGEHKAVYVDSAASHNNALTNTGVYYKNLERIYEAISVNDSNGDPLTFEEFPYILIPHRVDEDDHVMEDKWFKVLMVSEKQSIGDSVIINYPSIDEKTNTINLQDSEAYNPVPTMRRQRNINVGFTGYFKAEMSHGLNNFDVTIFGASFDEYDYDNQSKL
jgi:hypothetical protein